MRIGKFVVRFFHEIAFICKVFFNHNPKRKFMKFFIVIYLFISMSNNLDVCKNKACFDNAKNYSKTNLVLDMDNIDNTMKHNHLIYICLVIQTHSLKRVK